MTISALGCCEGEVPTFFRTGIALGGRAFLLRGYEVVGLGLLNNHGVYQKLAMPEIVQGRERQAEAPILTTFPFRQSSSSL